LIVAWRENPPSERQRKQKDNDLHLPPSSGVTPGGGGRTYDDTQSPSLSRMKNSRIKTGNDDVIWRADGGAKRHEDWTEAPPHHPPFLIFFLFIFILFLFSNESHM